MGGELAEALALFLPNRFPAWFRLLVAPDGRVLEAEMLAPGHFMTHRFSGFDEPVSIEPPTP